MTNSAVSIIICTRNRAESLRETLASIASCHVPPDLSAELLVVDNGSTDHTQQVIAEASVPNMPVRTVIEQKRGLSNARNRALQEATGDVLLFTDDDVRVPLDWIGRMCGPIVRGEADAVAGGVRLAQHLERDWLVGEIRGWLACTGGLIDPDRPDRFVGANAALGRQILARVPRYDEELGAGALGFAEETLFAAQMTEAGYRLAGALHVEVEHHPDPLRFCTQSFIDMAGRLGDSSAYMFKHWTHKPCRAVTAKCAYYGVMLAWWELRRRLLRGERKGPSQGHLNAAFQYRFHRYLIQHRGTPPNYERRGLVKRPGIGARCAAVGPVTDSDTLVP